MEINRQLLFNEISSENSAFTHTLGKSGDPADYITYEYNDLGYRSKEFEHNEKLLIAGCSQTFGFGVEKEHIWGNVVSRHFGIESANLSIPGSSCGAIVNNLFAYFKKFGHPKVLLVLFPDMYRFQIPTDPEIVSSKSIRTKKESNKEIPYLTYLHLNTHNKNNMPKNQRSPFDLEEMISPEISVFHNIKSIMLLNQYCDALNIKFYWSTWEQDADHTFMQLSKSGETPYNNYISSHSFKWFSRHSFEKDPFGKKINLITSSEYHEEYALDCENCRNNIDCPDIVFCHSDLEYSYPEIFKVGNDKVHMGTHEHQHLAEIFIQKIENDEISF
jgi:hypothetical protein